MRLHIHLGVFLLLPLLISALSRPSVAEELVGQGEWESVSSGAMRGTWSVELQRAGTDLRGTIKLTGSNLFSDGAVSGAIDGQQVVLGLVSENLKQVTFSGKLNGESISGEWDCPAIEDEGVWYGKLRVR